MDHVAPLAHHHGQTKTGATLWQRSRDQCGVTSTRQLPSQSPAQLGLRRSVYPQCSLTVATRRANHHIKMIVFAHHHQSILKHRYAEVIYRPANNDQPALILCFELPEVALTAVPVGMLRVERGVCDGRSRSDSSIASPAEQKPREAELSKLHLACSRAHWLVETCGFAFSNLDLRNSVLRPRQTHWDRPQTFSTPSFNVNIRPTR